KHCPIRSTAPEGRSLTPSSVRVSGKISASRVRQSQECDSWLQSWPLRHDKGVRFHQLIAQLPTGVVDEHVVQRGVLDRQGLYCDPSLNGCFDQLRSSARAIASKNAEHASSLMLHRGDLGQRAKALFPVGWRIVELNFNYVRSRYARLESRR